MPKLLAAAILALVATASVRVLDLENRRIDPFQASVGAKAVVFLFTATDCPISNRYAPEIQRVYQAYADKGVTFFLVYPNPADTPALIREHVKSFGYKAQPLRDPKHDLARFTGATITPEAAVYAGGRLVYRGRIDDRYVELGLERPTATTHDLADAIAAAVAGKPVPHATTQAVGCFIVDMAR